MLRGKGIFHFVNILIDFLMLISVNSAIREDNLLGTLFLFGGSYLGTFIGKRNCGGCGVSGDSNQKAIEKLNNYGLALSMLMLTMCMVVALGVVEIHVVSNGKFFPLGSEILLQSADGAYLTFGTVNVTAAVIIYMVYPCAIHFVIWLVETMDCSGIEVGQLISFWLGKWKKAFLFLDVSIFGGIVFCFGKYQVKIWKAEETAKIIEGKPQYWKYALLFAGMGFGLFLFTYGKKYAKQSYDAEK